MGDEEYRQLGVQLLAHPGDDLGALDVGQLPVNDQQIEGFAPQILEQRRARGVGAAGVAHGRQGVGEKLELERIVVQCRDAHGTPWKWGRSGQV